jgi:hypothetical protein
VLAVVAANATHLGPRTALAVIGVAALAGIAIGYQAWPALGRVLVAYGLAARIPVAVVMLIALAAGWGTHYEKGPPDFPAMGMLATWFWIGAVPQFTVWMAFTVLVGILIGSGVGAFRRAEGA